MKKVVSILSLLSICSALTTNAQGLLDKKEPNVNNTSKYYEAKGKVPVVDGKVKFMANYTLPGKSKNTIFDTLESWAKERFAANTEEGEWNDKNFIHNFDRSGLSMLDKDNGTIVCVGDEEIVFRSTALERDATRIQYTLFITIKDGAISADIRNISYIYDFTTSPSRVVAEKWITDKYGLNKKGQLAKYSGKFRAKTIDLADLLFEQIGNIVKE